MKDPLNCKHSQEGFLLTHVYNMGHVIEKLQEECSICTAVFQNIKHLLVIFLIYLKRPKHNILD